MNVYSLGNVKIDFSTVRPQDEQSGSTFAESDSVEDYVHIGEREKMEQDNTEAPKNGETECRRFENPTRVDMESGALQEPNSEEARLKQRVNALDKLLQDERDKNESLRDENESLRDENESLRGQATRLTEEINRLSKELLKEQAPSGWRKLVYGRRTANSAALGNTRGIQRKQVRYTKQPLEQNVNNVDADIMGKVHERLMKKSMDINELPWGQDRSHVPSIVFCIYASRLGNDVEEVLPKYVKESPVILVILHPVIKKRAAAGTLSSSEHLLSRDTKAKLFSIIHFAFSKDQGLYNCKPNEASLKKLTEILESFPGTAL